MRTGYALLLSLAPLIPVSARAHFTIKDSYVGHSFFDAWNWESLDDPTHGRVNYVDQGFAIAQNLSYATDSKFVMRADDFNTVGQGDRGRNSVRISSKNAYDESIIVLDLQHMPEGCSTWPAFWSLSQRGPWPHGGEIDYIEGVNLATQNLASLHTTPQCTMPQTRLQSGNPTSLDCDANVNYNQGCGVSFAKPASYGTPFNAEGGGFFAIVRTKRDGVRIWFWSRNEATVPPEIRNPPSSQGGFLLGGGNDEIYPTDSWGTPEAVFPLGKDASCDYDSHFDPHALVFDLTFCGDWAGSAYPTSGCGGNCNDFVDNNPSAFSDAYWEINSLRIYTPS
ncbi:concanavalin A-like lectin/glucanase domain-containing protein [Cristinia sonorae]|uniref:Concanavalin A-like lectin/glucanase domain-containing protein n=1 Tax=Cristinia sonorae TaxID=1940300 RepID=A0A8K0UY43_9AGAR|nr:concanavalin A-like lectin/glucanase domain-containing protein [Cristinia sonorae]